MFRLVQAVADFSKPREVVNSATRLGLQRYDANKEQKHKNPHQQNVFDSIGGNEEVAEFSVLSLIRFLEDFLEDRLGTTPVSKALSEDNTDTASWVNKRHANLNIAQKVTNAYAHAADIAYSALQKFSETENKGESLLDLNATYSLLQDLRTLYNRKVLTLPIKQDKPFLQGVRDAVFAFQKHS